jgi:hypothetical protein
LGFPQKTKRVIKKENKRPKIKFNFQAFYSTEDSLKFGKRLSLTIIISVIVSKEQHNGSMKTDAIEINEKNMANL